MKDLQFRIPVDVIKITGNPASKLVEFEAGNLNITFTPEIARQVAWALMTQADRAENGPNT
jgi:hypothetical protein